MLKTTATAGRLGPLAGWPDFAADEIAAAGCVLSSGRVNYWTGEEGRLFEQEFAGYVGTKYAVALANGTLALEAAIVATGLRPGDEVVVTPRTFIASASAAVLHGVRPVFADVDPDSQNVTAATVEAALTPRTRAIIAVHLAGWPCEMDAIMALARDRKLVVIEDCAQAHGATYRGRPVGSLGDVAAWSFCQDKIMSTAGEGGMLTAGSRDIWQRAWSIKDHGKDYEAVHAPAEGPGFRWVHHSFGTNMRMTEVQAAIGRLQLAKLSAWVAARRRNAAILARRLRQVAGLRVPEPPAHIGHAYYKFYAFVRPDRLRAGITRDSLIEAINRAGVPCFSGSCGEIYRERAFEAAGLQPANPLPVAAELGATSLMLLVHPTLSELEMEWMAETVAKVVEAASA